MSVAVGYSEFAHEQSEALKERFAYAKRVLKEALDVEVESLEPITRGYNNKVYILKLLPHVPVATSRVLQPGCVPFPSQTPDTLIFRTVRMRSHVPPPRKLLNAVATRQLVRENTDLPIASVYAYDVHAAEPWMVEAKLPGVPMDVAWQTADTDTRVRMLESLADVLAKLKGVPAPGGQFGGVGYDSEGKIVLGPTCLGYDEGPFATAKEHYKAWIGGQWEDAKKNPHTDGWKAAGLYDRIEKFVSQGLDSALACLDGCKPFLIHADFGLLNTMVSETTPDHVTGVLDFEWSHFGSESDEYFLSSPGPGMIYGGPYDVKPDSRSDIRVRNLLAGTTPDDPGEDLLTYKMDALLKARNVGTFSTIPNFQEIARLYWFGEYVRPWFFYESGTQRSPEGQAKFEEKIKKTKEKSAICFDKDLKIWGY
ncbi:hypothetical protein B0H16DRAFT_186063 [Mycena metata]|uniref:Aminoglycoside phosphotransferase domain-containing protein n=1 Tax=Mycena metata TaxID=1033252 RepID=A0AAD7JT96_9AGAR|nr:hypothetical protein B0H16DRAFT_186063 [Mycena metata]